MTGLLPPAILPPMDDASVHIGLELDAGDPPAGRVRDATGAARPFTGWLELMSAVERLWGDAPGGRHDDHREDLDPDGPFRADHPIPESR